MNLNDHLWDENIACPMSESSIALWQKKLNDLAGTESDGTPHLKLEWGQDPQALELDRLANVWLPRHHWDTKNGVEQVSEAGLFLGYKPVYIGVPRMFVVAYVPPVHFPDTELEQHKVGDDTFLPHPIKEATWLEMQVIKTCKPRIGDSFACCIENASKGRNCYGYYRPFDMQDFEYIRKCFRQWLRLNLDPNKTYQQNDHRQIFRDHFSAKKAREMKEHEERVKHMMEIYDTLQRDPVSVGV